MYGIYIQYHNPYGKHYLDVRPTLEGVCALLKEHISNNSLPTPKLIESSFVATDYYYQKFTNGTQIVIQRISSRTVMAILDYYKNLKD